MLVTRKECELMFSGEGESFERSQRVFG